jgi:hypothetical protein
VSILREKIKRKKGNAEKVGLAFRLTREEVEKLLGEAGITAEDWSRYGYHLARFGDTGDYEVGNCRFIPAKENYAEKVISNRHRESARRIMTNYVHSLSREEQLVRVKRTNEFNVGGHNKLTNDQLKEKFDKVKHIDFSRWRSRTQAAKILGCTGRHASRLVKRWKEIGLI